MGSVYHFAKSRRREIGFDFVLQVPVGVGPDERAYMQWLLQNLQAYDVTDAGPDVLVLTFVDLVDGVPVARAGDESEVIISKVSSYSLPPLRVRLFPTASSIAFVCGGNPIPLPLDDELGQLKRIQGTLRRRNRKYSIKRPLSWKKLLLQQEEALTTSQTRARMEALAEKGNRAAHFETLANTQEQMIGNRNSVVASQASIIDKRNASIDSLNQEKQRLTSLVSEDYPLANTDKIWPSESIAAWASLRWGGNVSAWTVNNTKRIVLGKSSLHYPIDREDDMKKVVDRLRTSSHAAKRARQHNK